MVLNETLRSRLEAHIFKWFQKNVPIHEGQTLEISVEILAQKPVIVETGTVITTDEDQKILDRVVAQMPDNFQTRLRNCLKCRGITGISQVIAMDQTIHFNTWKNVGKKTHVLFAHALHKEGITCFYVIHWMRSSIDQLETPHLRIQELTSTDWEDIFSVTWNVPQTSCFQMLKDLNNDPVAIADAFPEKMCAVLDQAPALILHLTNNVFRRWSKPYRLQVVRNFESGQKSRAFMQIAVLNKE